MQLKQTLALALAGRVLAQDNGPPDLATALENESLSALSALLQANPQLTEALNNMQNVTLLAPGNAALNALNSSDAASALTQPGYLQALLSYHVLNGTYFADNFTDTPMFIPTMLTNETYTNVTDGQRVEARLTDGNVTFYSALRQNASVTTPNLNFTGGTIHIIDNLLMIPGNDTETLRNANLTAAAGSIRDANLTDTLAGLRDVTIFAPSNEAFAAVSNLVANFTPEMLAQAISYHVVENSLLYSTDITENTTLTAVSGQDLNITIIDGTVFVNSAKVINANILAANGVVHVIDQVLNANGTTNGTDLNPDATTTTAAFPGASTATDGSIPYTSGIDAPESTFPAASPTGEDGTPSSSSTAAAVPMKTAAVGAAALFGGAAAMLVQL